MGWAGLVEEEDILGQAEEKERQRHIAYRCHQSTAQCALSWLWGSSQPAWLHLGQHAPSLGVLFCRQTKALVLL